MKKAAVCCIQDLDEYLPYTLDSVIDSVDYVVFLVGSQSWGTPENKTKNEFKLYMSKLEKTNTKIKVIFGDWLTETEQRNYGTQVAKELGCELILVWDSDECYGSGMCSKLLNILEKTPEAAALKGSWYTFWKKSPLCVISPPESFQPYLAYKVDKFQFTEHRNGMGLQNGELVPPMVITLGFDQLMLFHFSWARTDEFVKNKINSTSHKKDTNPNWYNDVWLKWNPAMRNIHPCWAAAYQQAVPFGLDQLPPKLKGYFIMQSEKIRWLNERK